MTHPITTEACFAYRVTDSRACAVVLPMGRLIRHLVVDSQFQGRPDGEWIARVDDAGLIRGYVRATLTEQMPTSFGIASNWTEKKAQPALPLPVRRRPRFVGIGRYWVTAPDGTAHRVRNLARFCRGVGLDVAPLYDVVRGRRKSYRGWRVRRIAS